MAYFDLSFVYIVWLSVLSFNNHHIHKTKQQKVHIQVKPSALDYVPLLKWPINFISFSVK